jgi:hypothetical protein
MRTPTFDDFAPPPESQLIGVGSLCGLLQVMPPQLRTLMEATGVRFSLILDGVGFLTLADAARLAEHCHDVRQEIADKAAAAPQN